MPRATRREEARAQNAAGLSLPVDRHVLEGYKVKLALEKLWKAWEVAYRDPLKAHMGNLVSGVLEVANQVKLTLVKKFAHDEPNATRIKDDFLRCIRGNIIQPNELLALIESGVLSVSTGENTVNLLCARLSLQPCDYIIRADTVHPVRTELRWDAIGSGRIQLSEERLMTALLAGLSDQTSSSIQTAGLERPARRSRRAA